MKYWFSTAPRNLPPIPVPVVPVIGHLHLLKEPLHRNLYNLSEKYSPVFRLQLGCSRAVVVSSPIAVQECFTKNDVLFANRPLSAAGKYLGYNNTNMVASPYGEHWRNLRRLAAMEIFSAARLNLFLPIRKDEIKRLLLKLYENSRYDYAHVELKSKLPELSFNIIMRMVAGKRYFGEDEENQEAKSFRELIHEMVKYGTAANPGDFFPLLKWIDYGNHEKKLATMGKKMDMSLQRLIDEQRRDKNGITMIAYLLSLQESRPEYAIHKQIGRSC